MATLALCAFGNCQERMTAGQGISVSDPDAPTKHRRYCGRIHAAAALIREDGRGTAGGDTMPLRKVIEALN